MQMARGESKTFTFTVADDAGDPVSLVGATITFTVTDLAGDAVLELSSEDVDSQIVPDEEDDNVFTVEITADDSDLDPGARWADCVVVTGAAQTLKVTEHEPFYVTGT